MPTRIAPTYRVAMLNARSNAQGRSPRRALKLAHVSHKDSLDGTLKLHLRGASPVVGSLISPVATPPKRSLHNLQNKPSGECDSLTASDTSVAILFGYFLSMIRTHLLAKAKNPFAESVRKTAKPLDKILAVLSETSHCHPGRLRSVTYFRPRDR